MEIEYLKQMQVYLKVPIQEAREGGRRALLLPWMGVKNADRTHRPRVVAKDIKTCKAPERIAATPPSESLKYLLQRSGQDLSLSIMPADVTRVYFDANAGRGMCV